MSVPDDIVDVGDGKDDKERDVNREKERIGSLLMKQTSVRGHKNKSLNEQQRIQQRINIGLPTLPSANVSGASFIHNLTSAGYKTYVQTNFKRKECTKYVARESGDICKCGVQERDHKDLTKLFGVEVLTVEQPENDEKDSHIKEFPTNACGKIEFEGGQTAKYLRLADNTPMEKIREFISEYDSLLKLEPHMALSIIGGNMNFKLDGKKRDIFKKGVISAAQATNAWIISGGTNTGCMKLIGEIVKEGQFLASEGIRMRKGIRTIGICSWGFIAHSDSLINPYMTDKVLTPEGVKSIHKVDYNSNVKIKKFVKPPLNPNHSRFLLVDDGISRNHFDWESGGVAKFRANFEKMIRKPKPEGFGIPILTLLLEGGIDAIHEVKESVNRKEPCVIIEGSGRAADILAFAYNHAEKNTLYTKAKGGYYLKEEHIKHLETELKVTFNDKIHEESYGLNNIVNWIKEIIQHSGRITIFNINMEEDRDKKILCAVLKDEYSTVEHKMMMSMMWNRPDIAEEMIFNDPNRDFKWSDRPFDEVMTQALLRDNVKFIEMLFLNGFSLKWFLTATKLRELYNKAANEFPELKDQLEKYIGHDRGKIFLNHIHNYLTVIMKNHKHPFYEEDRLLSEHRDKTFEDPNFEMFLWSILTNRSDLAEFFWSQSDHPVLATIFASTLYGFLNHFMYKNRSTSQRIHDLKQYYLEKANNIMELAYKKDRDKAIELVERKFERFGNNCMLDLAFMGHLKSFIANTPSHDAISGIWKRGFIKLNVWMGILTIFCPFLLLTPKFKFMPLGEGGSELNFWEKLLVFYKAPVIKYLGHVISYTIFLCLYACTALFHFNWEFNLIEMSVYVWFLTLIADEIMEILGGPGNNLKSKLRIHLCCVWNRLDLIIYIFAVAGFAFKNWEETFGVSRVLFAVNLFLLYMRILRMYHASLALGPKLVIMQRMLPEIASFLFLLIIFILGYGTAREALLKSYSSFNVTHVPEILNDVLFIPIWEMLGELEVEALVPTKPHVCYMKDGSLDTFISGKQRVIENPLDNQQSLPHEEGKFCEDFTWYEPVVKVFLAVYMLIANVMLLNLIIAVFTSIFSKVQENSKIVWRYEKYRMVKEFSTKPFLAPPLAIFQHLVRFLRLIWAKVNKDEMKKGELDILLSEMLISVDLFEKDCSNSYKKKKLQSDIAKNGKD